MTQAPAPAGTIILIQGGCLRGMAWENWLGPCTARGYRVMATLAPLRNLPRACLDWYGDQLARMNTVLAADYYEHLMQTMDTPPILIGHCLGGTIVQLLLERGLGAAGVAINTPPAPDVALVGSRANGAEPIIDYSDSHRAPLLMVGSGADFQVPSHLIALASDLYRLSDIETGYLEYPDAHHHAIRSPGWEQLAEDVLDWTELHTERPVVVQGRGSS